MTRTALLLPLLLISSLCFAQLAPVRVMPQVDLPDQFSDTPIGAARNAAVSADGNIVALISNAVNLVDGQVDTNGQADLFVINRSAGTVTLVSHTGDGKTTLPRGVGRNLLAITPSGSAIAFTSGSAFPDTTDTNDRFDVFLYDVSSGNVRLISHAAGTPTTAADNNSGNTGELFLSDDGRFVAFETVASNLGFTDNSPNRFDAVVYDTTTETLRLLNNDAGNGNPGDSFDQASGVEAMSADGRYLVYSARVQPGFTDPARTGNDLFLYDQGTDLASTADDVIRLISHDGTNFSQRMGIGISDVALSADGQWIGFTSGRDHGFEHPGTRRTMYLYSTADQSIRLLARSASDPNRTTSGQSVSPSISANGNIVAWADNSNDYVFTRNTSANDVYVYNRGSDTLSLVSHLPGDTNAGGSQSSFNPAVAADGSAILFSSNA